MKTWLCGITRGPVSALAPSIESVYDCFDGLIWTVDDRATPDVAGYINYRAGAGKAIVHPFMNAHDWQANEYLHCGLIKPGDYVCVLDTTDRLNSTFVHNLRENIKYWDKNNVGTIFLDRPFIFKFTGHQFFQNTPHWGISMLMGNVVDLTKIEGYRKENYLINKRNVNVSGIEHPIKYFIEYKRSNHTALLYSQFGQDVYRVHETNRVSFQYYVETELNIPCTVSSLVDYLTKTIETKTVPDRVVDYIESEVNMCDLVRYYILKQDFLGEIAKNRFNWSFKKYYHLGIEHQGKDDGYVGLFNKYRLKQNKEME